MTCRTDQNKARGVAWKDPFKLCRDLERLKFGDRYYFIDRKKKKKKKQQLQRNMLYNYILYQVFAF